MKLIITESQYKRIISEKDIDEGLLSSLIRRIPSVVKSPTLFINKQAIRTIYRDISRIIPKQYLTNKEELRALIGRYHKLGKNLDILKGPYIRKYGQEEYDSILRKYLYGSMDDKKFIETLKNVKNPTIRVKPVMGSGADHMVYKSELYPDKLFKVEMRPGEIDKWFTLFQSHPDVFPKTFKRTTLKTPDGKILSSVVVENLSTAPFQKLWDDMEKLIYQSQTNLKPQYRNGLEYISKRINNPIYKKIFDDFLIYSKKQNPQISAKVQEFHTMVNKLYKIAPRPDIRKFNFGYDKMGKLKSLDI